MFVRFVVSDDTSCRGTCGAVTDHVTGHATDDRTFNASLSTRWGRLFRRRQSI